MLPDSYGPCCAWRPDKHIPPAVRRDTCRNGEIIPPGLGRPGNGRTLSASAPQPQALGSCAETGFPQNLRQLGGERLLSVHPLDP